MNKFKENGSLIALMAIVVILAASFLRSFPSSTTNFLGHGGPLESNNYQAFPTSTLTTSYSGTSSTVILAKGLPNIAIGGTYTPKSYGSWVAIKIERSIDNGNTFYPYSTITPESTDTLINTNGTGTTAGTPFIVPGNAIGTATSNTSIAFSFDLSMVADYIRISAKETTTSTAGTLDVQTTLTSN